MENAIKLAGIVNSQPRRRYVKITSPKINLWLPKLDKFMDKVKLTFILKKLFLQLRKACRQFGFD